VTTGQHLSCALIDEGVKCWGENSSGQLGRGTSGGSFAIPESVLSLEPGGGKGVSAIDAGDDHVCAIVHGGLKCWGDNRMGQTGNGQLMTPITVPVPVAGYGPGSSLVALSAGEQYTCASNGYITCWGNGSAFTRGDGLGQANEVVPHPALSAVP
jgi:alpha-tubulin suppressor-like RCC1 family protein